jgi:hypothetical protein
MERDGKGTVCLIGVNHKYQIGPHGVVRVDASDEDFEEFAKLIRAAVESHSIRGVAEEMSVPALRKHFVNGPSFPCELAAKIGLPHRYCDPEPKMQEALNIKSSKQREDFWLQEIKRFNIFPLLFILGADHVDSFEALLTESGMQPIVVAPNWDSPLSGEA